jgi:RHS repeat-associated protein
VSYAYNSLGRLKEVREGGALVASFDYDANGNRLHETGPNGTITSIYDEQDRLLSRGTAMYRYTANGEVSAKINGADTTKYQYNASGALLGVTLPNGTSIDYVLDGSGRRIGRKVNGVLVQGFLYSDKLAPIAELDGQSNIVSRFVYGIGGSVPSYMLKDGVTYALITDHVGSVRLVVNSSTGAVMQRIDYDAWGRVTQNTNPGFQPFGFAGGLYDESTGLVRFGARSYDAESGRWTSKDPIGFAAGPNTYRYAGDDPVNFSDPSGLASGLNKAAQVAAGIGDALTGGLTRRIRQAMDADDVIDRCSSWYKGGEVAGIGLGLALGGAMAAEAAAGEVGVAVEEGLDASSAINRLRLGQQLASEEQVGEAGISIAGAGSEDVLRQAGRLATEYGGNPDDWAKMTSSAYQSADGLSFQTHWYENINTGVRTEFKTNFSY